MLFAINKVVLFGNRVMRIMFELKTEKMGGKGCIMWSFVIYTACQILGYHRAVVPTRVVSSLMSLIVVPTIEGFVFCLVSRV